MKFVLIASLIMMACVHSGPNPEAERMEKQGSAVTIIRDQWGIPHVYGRTDAEAVFGLMYAQCEENFERVERSYISRLGRLSEIEGSSYFYEDLQSRLLFDTSEAIKDYKNSEPWMKALLDAFADGINYYLLKHPRVKPRLLTNFKPWYPLLFTDGAYVSEQTGGLTLKDMKDMYGTAIGETFAEKVSWHQTPANGSNAFAIAASKSASGNSLLYINPHVSFYFRTESHLNSEEGLNAYGAVTWGQFFVYQGFNEYNGWAHTSTMADAADLYQESVQESGGEYFYEFEDSLYRMKTKDHFFRVRTESKMETIKVKAYYTHRGPVVGSRKGKWMSLRAKNRSYDGLVQSWKRMKTNGYESFANLMRMSGNSTCNTMFADRNGTIAYWHGNFIPRRKGNLDYSKPIDGRTSAGDWMGKHELKELIHWKDPVSGWLQNCNSSPFFATEGGTLNAAAFPAYMAPDGENFRSARARKLLSETDSISIDKLIAIGYDRYLSAFDTLLPPLIASYDKLNRTDSLYAPLHEAIEFLRPWNKYADKESVALTIASEWAYKIFSHAFRHAEPENDQLRLLGACIRRTDGKTQLQLLLTVIRELESAYGNWKIPYGEIVRFQRPDGKLFARFDDRKPSSPVSLASSFFGCLPSFEAVYDSTYKMYGVAGNSFVAAVEFGKKVKAKAVSAGGQSFNRESRNFNDQTDLFLDGQFREVYFYPEDVWKNAARRYHPAER